MKKKFTAILFVVLLLFGLSLLISRVMKTGLEEEMFANQIAVIPIKGAITVGGSGGYPFESSGASSTKIVENIEKAGKDEKIKAIILDINSPGGSVVASKEIATAVKNSKKPVVAWIREIGTSGAYWVASSADEIVVDEMSITGSIGVIGSYLEFSELFEKYGVTYQELKSGEYKDIGSPFKKLTNDEKGILQTKINDIHEYFINEVSKNRKLEKDRVRDIANGLFYFGNEAKELGLVDYTGDKKFAVKRAEILAGISKSNLVEFEEKKGLLDILEKLSMKSFYFFGYGFGSAFYNNVKTNELDIRI